MLQRKQRYATRVEKNPTTEAIISDSKNTTRYNRQAKSKLFLEYIHGGETGAIYGAWDFLTRHANHELLQNLIIGHKNGKFVSELTSKMKSNVDGPSATEQALATKYLCQLSRRKYQYMCAVQKSVPTNEGPLTSVSHKELDAHAKAIDIGEVHLIPGVCGVSRTLASLTHDIIKLAYDKADEPLIWFKGNVNHFVVEFSDDGAPESKEHTMDIGSLALWNVGKRIRSRDYHHILHMLTASEKDPVCERLWLQYAEAMAIVEGNVMHINGNTVTIEFQPSADQSWQHWAGNTVSAAATYPSPYANVHKSETSKIGGTIGHSESDTWTPPTMKSIESEVAKVAAFLATLASDLSDDRRHDRLLEYLADTGIRQLGPPRIAMYAERLRPEPLHLEINNWIHLLYVIYIEAIRRNVYSIFLSVLKSKNGCDLGNVASRVHEHYSDAKVRHNKLPVRMIGSQCIKLAQNVHSLVDTLKIENEQGPQIVKRLAIGKICQALRDIGTLMNKVNVNESYPVQLSCLCTKFFNLYALFVKESCQSTVWTLGYALPYHARLLHSKYGVGYGILSMQGKESKHAQIKQELRNQSNRSQQQNENGKWFQLMRSHYIRTMYLPYHFPVPSVYHSHFQSRVKLQPEGSFCTCSRPLNDDQMFCEFCISSLGVVECALEGKLTEAMLAILMPLCCPDCGDRFPDKVQLNQHANTHLEPAKQPMLQINPSTLKVAELRKMLQDQGLSDVGSRAILCKRLNAAMTKNI